MEQDKTLPTSSEEDLVKIVSHGRSFHSLEKVESAIEELSKLGYSSDKIESLNPVYFSNKKIQKDIKEGITMSYSSDKSEEGFASFVNGVGYATVVIGVIIAIALLLQFGKPGMFSNGQISGSQLLIAVGVGFYHLVFGILCVGVAKVLRR